MDTSLFNLLVLSFSDAALQGLGLREGMDNKLHKDLESAQYNIAMLEMLQEKTKNNLESEESSLLSEVLSDLRFKYIEVSKKT